MHVPKKTIAAFCQDDADDEHEQDMHSYLMAQSDSANKQAAKAKMQALEEDPTIYDYDDVYEDFASKSTSRRGPQGTASNAGAKPQQEKKKSQYIETLLKKAQFREKEKERITESVERKAIEKEEDLYAGKEKFLTKEYKKKLLEDQKWDEEMRKRELEEAKNDVTKQGDMSGFYRGLLTRNTALGHGEETQTKMPEGWSVTMMGQTALLHTGAEAPDEEMLETEKVREGELKYDGGELRPVTAETGVNDEVDAKDKSFDGLETSQDESFDSVPEGEGAAKRPVGVPIGGPPPGYKLIAGGAGGIVKIGEEEERKRLVPEKDDKKGDEEVMSAKERYRARKMAKLSQ